MIEENTVLHENSAERPTSEVSSQYRVRVVRWRRDKDSCRIQVPSKPYVCPDLYTAEVCDVPGTGYVRMGMEIPSKFEDKLRFSGFDRKVHIPYQTVHICQPIVARVVHIAYRIVHI